MMGSRILSRSFHVLRWKAEGEEPDEEAEVDEADAGSVINGESNAMDVDGEDEVDAMEVDEEGVLDGGRESGESGSPSADAPLAVKPISVGDCSEGSCSMMVDRTGDAVHLVQSASLGEMVGAGPRTGLVTSGWTNADGCSESSRVAPGSSSASSPKGLKRLQDHPRSYLGAAAARLGLGKFASSLRKRAQRRGKATGFSSGTPGLKMEAFAGMCVEPGEGALESMIAAADPATAAFLASLPSSVSWYVAEVPGRTWIGRRVSEARKTGKTIRNAVANAIGRIL